MVANDADRKTLPDTRWVLLKLVLLALTIAAWWGWNERPSGEHMVPADKQQRMPVTHPILESDRPDLLGEPGTEMAEPGADTWPGAR